MSHIRIPLRKFRDCKPSSQNFAKMVTHGKSENAKKILDNRGRDERRQKRNKKRKMREKKLNKHTNRSQEEKKINKQIKNM